MAKKGEIVGAVDFGSRSIRVLIARQGPDGAIQIIGHGTAPSRGCVAQGIIQDLTSAQMALKRALADAEKESGVKVPSLFCGVNGKNVQTVIREGSVKLEKELVELEQMNEALAQASNNVLAAGKRPVSSISSREWYVDDLRVGDPLGLRGSVLKTRVHFAMIPNLIEDNLTTCVESQGRELEDIVYTPLAAGLGCLTPEDIELGVAVLDLGRTTTGLSVYRERRILATQTFDWGGFHVTRDVAAGLQVSFEEAVELVVEYAISEELISELAASGEADEAPRPASSRGKSSSIKLKSAVRGASSIVEREDLDSIIFERSQELLTKVRQHLYSRGLAKNLVRGVVLAGGAAAIRNQEKLAEVVFEAPARVGLPEGIDHLPQPVNAPDFVPVVGVARHGLEYRAALRNGRIELQRGPLGTVLHAVGGAFRKYFF